MNLSNLDYRFGSYIIEWVKRHSHITGKIIFLCLIWLILSVSIVSMCGQVGVGLMDVNMTEQHIVGAVTDTSYNQWNNLIMPLISAAFITMHILIFIIIGLCVISMFVVYKYNVNQ